MKLLLEAERRHNFEEVRLHKNNSSSLWKIINHVIHSKDKERPAYTKNLTVVANEFKQFFSKVSTDADTSPILDELLNLRTVTCEEVCWVVASLLQNKSPGPHKG